MAIFFISHVLEALKKEYACTSRDEYRTCIKSNAVNPSKLLQYHQTNSYLTK